MQKHSKKPRERDKMVDPRSQPGNHGHPDPCDVACSPIVTRRNRYFTGRYLTAHDFRLEQGYFLSRHRLHNRLFHGWGVACGLEVQAHMNPNCANHVIVRPGIAIDCCGREIILDKEQVIEIWDPDDPPQAMQREDRDKQKELEEERYPDQSQQQAEQAKPPEPAPSEGGPAYLVAICYCEQLSEFAPTLYDDGSCGGDVCGSEKLEANRISESATLHVIPWDAENRRAYAGCWPAEKARPQPCRDDCDGPAERPDGGCLDPICPCDLCVPLVLVRPVQEKRGFAIVDGSLDFSGRRELITPGAYLTHIAGLNWTHGGEVSFSELVDPEGMNGELRITFDRKLLAPASSESETDNGQREPVNLATGINEFTFMVQEHRRDDVRYPLTVLHSDSNPPYLDEDGCTAVFPIDDDLLKGYRTLAGSLLHVILRCDFILDCHWRAVDGEHHKGQLPSGDGREGGTFESWFLVVGDDSTFRGSQRRSK